MICPVCSLTACGVHSSSRSSWDCLKGKKSANEHDERGKEVQAPLCSCWRQDWFYKLLSTMWMNGMERFSEIKGKSVFNTQFSEIEGHWSITVLWYCSHRFNLWWESSLHTSLPLSESLIASVFLLLLIAFRTELFWSSFLAFYIILLLLSFAWFNSHYFWSCGMPCVFLFLWTLWSLSFLSRVFWCSS